MNFLFSEKGTNVYKLIIVLISLGVFISQIKLATFYIDWILFGAMAVGIIICDYFNIPKPPKGVVLFSMDTAIYMASLITFGIEIALLLLFISNLISAIFRIPKIKKWWNYIFNISIYSIMLTGSYYMYVFLGGKVGLIDLEQIYALLGALITYFILNIILITPCFYFTSQTNPIWEIIKDFLKNTLSIYLVILAASYILIVMLNEPHPVFGLLIFLFIIILLSVEFKRTVRLYEEVSKDKVYREQILNSLPVGVITIEDETSKVDLNTAASRLLKMNLTELKEKLQKEGSHDSLFWHYVSSHEKFKNIKAEYETDEERHLLLISQSELIDQYQQLIGRIIYFIDITDTEELEKRINQSEKLAILGELAAGAAHEIRNPLAVIQGFLTLMNESLQDLDKEKYHLPLLLKEFKRMDSLVEEMLLLAKPGNPLLKEGFLEDIVKEILPLFDSNETGQEINFKLNIERTPLLLDAKQMTQVFYNLFRNSSEAIGNTGWISISSKTHDGSYYLYIQDSGPGIPVEIEDKLFEPFQTTKASGTGLGLTVVQRIIENHHGKISLIRDENQKSLFLIGLPLIEEN
ncbi:two-component system sensor histidine kinase NtrB [Bacillus sp. PS06]|uniref:two-component system sensor histidine kinase NtrB n=1 Tax=Bacillus sp. PS06 TaxID=2764176 RepID=UPI001780BD69|nr:ATP-binding protein [Bacillus sp. PS06]MBD8070126.1 GHKL domain-containing protein [Bacillus sp. PS06]